MKIHLLKKATVGVRTVMRPLARSLRTKAWKAAWGLLAEEARRREDEDYGEIDWSDGLGEPDKDHRSHFTRKKQADPPPEDAESWMGLDLTEGWRRVRAKAGAAGPNGVGVGTYERGIELRLRQLREQLSDGIYAPSPPREVILKKHGKRRPLALFNVEDRIVQSALARAVATRIDGKLSAGSFAYRPGMGVEDALRAALRPMKDGFRQIIRLDIEDCFGTIPHGSLMTLRCFRFRAEFWTRDILNRLPEILQFIRSETLGALVRSGDWSGVHTILKDLGRELDEFESYFQERTSARGRADREPAFDENCDDRTEMAEIMAWFGVARAGTFRDMKGAMRRRALEVHPDRFPNAIPVGKLEANERMKEVNSKWNRYCELAAERKNAGSSQ